MVKKTFYKTKDYCKVKFTLDIENAKTISIHGLNNDWETPVKMKKKKDGAFTADVKLPKDSRQEFKYFINKSEWLNEPEADEDAPNMYGGTNSVLTL